MFLDTELNKNKLEINKWDMEIDELIEYKYKNNSQIVDIIKVIQIRKQQYKDITLAKYKIRDDWLYY